MKTRKNRLRTFFLVAIGLSLAVGFSLWALKDSVSFFYTPSDLIGIEMPEGNFRLGGLVEEDSLNYDEDSLAVTFRITDYDEAINIRYEGILPDLFKEEKGAVVMGAMGDDGVFEAVNVLAKHDENYMAPEVARALDDANAEEGSE